MCQNTEVVETDDNDTNQSSPSTTNLKNINESNNALGPTSEINIFGRHSKHCYKWSLSDFELHTKPLSSNFYSQVFRGRYKNDSSRQVAIKVWDKYQLSKPQNVGYRNAVMQERRILSKLTHNKFVISLHMSFVDEHNLYMVMDLFIGKHIGRDPTAAPYYAAEILSALEWLHFHHGIVHGDLKPSNILVRQNSIKLIDFGAAIISSKDTIASSNVVMGTADYIAPEVLTGKSDSNDMSYICARDLWSFGCIIYFMYVGASPFHAETDYLAMENILSLNPSTLLLQSIIPLKAQHVIQSLLTRYPVTSRLGAMDHEQMKMSKIKQYKSLRELPYFSNTTDKVLLHSDHHQQLHQQNIYSDSGPIVDGAKCGFDFFAV